MSLSVFVVLLGLTNQTARIKYIHDFAMLAKTSPLLAFTLGMTFFSMAGIPPFAGFFAKLQVLIVACSEQLWWVALFAIFVSVVSCFYYIRVVKAIYFEPVEDWVSYQPLSGISSALLTMCFFALLGFAVYPSPLLSLVHWTALHFIN